jgi:hypothetical protein
MRFEVIHGTSTCTAVLARERIERKFRRTDSSSCFTKIVKNNWVQMDTCSRSPCNTPFKITTCKSFWCSTVSKVLRAPTYVAVLEKPCDGVYLISKNLYYSCKMRVNSAFAVNLSRYWRQRGIFSLSLSRCFFFLLWLIVNSDWRVTLWFCDAAIIRRRPGVHSIYILYVVCVYSVV